MPSPAGRVIVRELNADLNTVLLVALPRLGGEPLLRLPHRCLDCEQVFGNLVSIGCLVTPIVVVVAQLDVIFAQWTEADMTDRCMCCSLCEHR